MRRFAVRYLIAASIAVLALAPGGALAAPKAITAAPVSVIAPLAQGPFDAQIWPGQDSTGTAIIVDIQVPDSVKLPARVRIPIPTGGNIEWAGEILGGSADADPERPYTVGKGAGGGSYAEFTLEKSHRGQIDMMGSPLTVNGYDIATQVEWIQSVPSTSTLFTVRLPAGVSQVAINPAPTGKPETNLQGESLYVLPSMTLSDGQKTAVTVAYNTSPTGAVTPKPGPDRNTVYLWLGIALVIAVIVLIFVINRQRHSGDSDDEDDGNDEGPFANVIDTLSDTSFDVDTAQADIPLDETFEPEDMSWTKDD